MFFPSWRFFENPGDRLVLHYRTAGRGNALGLWKPALPRPARRWSALFLNPAGNLYLACETLLQHLADDIGEREIAEPGKILSSVSYQLVVNLVQFQIARPEQVERPVQFQLRVGLVNGETVEPVLLSPVMDCGSL